MCAGRPLALGAFDPPQNLANFSFLASARTGPEDDRHVSFSSMQTYEPERFGNFRYLHLLAPARLANSEPVKASACNPVIAALQGASRSLNPGSGATMPPALFFERSSLRRAMQPSF